MKQMVQFGTRLDSTRLDDKQASGKVIKKKK